MKEPIDIYSEYNVDVNKLTRDYLKFPLRKITKQEYEKLPKEDFVYLYIECNLPRKVLEEYLNVSKTYINRLRKSYNIRKTMGQMVENYKKTCVVKFGVENVSYLDECKEKRKQTCLKHFGVENPLQSPIVQEKIKQTNLQNLGVERPAQSPLVQEKMKQTCLQNYGVENPFQSPIVQEKMKQTCLQIYGVENYAQTDECQEKMKQTNLERYGVEYSIQSPIVQEKIKQTNLQNYGVENPLQSPIIREKVKQTNLEKFGVENYTQTNEYKNLYKDEEFVKNKQQKQYETKKKNNSFRKSEEEDKIYDMLLTKFKEVIRQYHSDLYPFNCDFYIPEIDLYIEYQGYWGHGKEPYLGTDEQKEIVKKWENESQEKPQYLNAIKVWTISDPLKRYTVKQNELNWVEFFNIKEFNNWFESICA